MNDFIYSNPVFFSEISKLVSIPNSNKKFVLIKGSSQMGKTFTLKNIQKELLQDKLSIYLSLDEENAPNPLILKNGILKCIKRKCDKGENIRKTDFKSMLFSILKGVSIKSNLPASPVELSLSTEAIITEIDRALGGFKKEIENIPSPQNAYIEELVSVTKAICDSSNEMLYLLIDDYQFISEEIRIFIKLLIESEVKLGIFVTTEEHKGKQEAVEWIVNTFIHEKEKYIEELECFNKETIIHYITKNVDTPEELSIPETAEKIIKLTYGVPGYVSLLTNDIKTLDNIEKNNSFSLIMRTRFESLSNKEKEIVKLIYVNGNAIPEEVFDNISKFDSDEYDEALQSLISHKIVSELPDGYDSIYKLNFPAMVPEIISRRKKRLAKEILASYLMTKHEHKDTYSYLNDCLKLAMIIGDNEIVFQYTCEFSDYLLSNFKYEKAIEVLEEVLNDFSLSLNQKVQVKIKLVENLLRAAQMEEIEKIYDKLPTEERVLIEKQYSYILISFAKAFYYLNKTQKTLSILTPLIFVNEADKLERIKLICSSFDLEGDYKSSKEKYYNFLESKENDEEAKYTLKIYILMVEKNHLKCVNSLKSSINYFENYSTRNPRIERLLATAYNNLGIEYVMHGNFEDGKKYLEKSLEKFEKFRSDEKIFPLNNLGLVMSFIKDYATADELFSKAFKNAISPLQKSYIMQNIAILRKLQDDKVSSHESFNHAKIFSKQCPDPVVKNYTILNGLFLEDKHIEKNELHYLDKDQLSALNYKRKKYLLSEPSFYSDSDRRTYFAKLQYEPCELMFYN